MSNEDKVNDPIMEAIAKFKSQLESGTEILISKEVMETVNEIKRDLGLELLVGDSKWTNETRVQFTMKKVRELEKSISEFESQCKVIDDKANEKKEALRKNWRIDEKVNEIEKLRKGVQSYFED